MERMNFSQHGTAPGHDQQYWCPQPRRHRKTYLATTWASYLCRTTNYLRTSPLFSVRCAMVTFSTSKITSRKNLHPLLHFATSSISRNSLNYDILEKILHPISDITKIHSDVLSSIFPSALGNTQSPVSLHARTTTWLNISRPNTRPCHLIRPLVAARHDVWRKTTTPAQSSTDKEKIGSDAAAKATKAKQRSGRQP